MKNKAAEQEGQGENRKEGEYIFKVFLYTDEKVTNDEIANKICAALHSEDNSIIVVPVPNPPTPLQPSGTGEPYPYTCPNCGAKQSSYEIEHGHTCRTEEDCIDNLGEEGEKEVNKGAKARKFERLMMPDKNFSSAVDKEERLNRLEEAVADLQELNATSADAPQIKASAGQSDSEEVMELKRQYNSLYDQTTKDATAFKQTIAQQEQRIKELKRALKAE